MGPAKQASGYMAALRGELLCAGTLFGPEELVVVGQSTVLQ